jgi:NTE family protein
MSVALVLSGGGARGAYEIGALSVLLPELERRGERPIVLVGTSVGAFNCAYLAARAHVPAQQLVDEALPLWSSFRHRDVLAPIASGSALGRTALYVRQLLGLGGPRIDALLDPEPLPRTLARIVSFGEIRDNVDARRVTLAVTATSAYSGRTVVFHAGGGAPPPDPVRQIDYVDTDLRPEHVRASGAIPVIFPPVHVPIPERARGWYYDGGTRLNTPIKPAVALGADRLVVIGLNSTARVSGDRLADERRPNLFEGAAQIVQALLVDRLVEDVRELAEENLPGHDERRIPYMFVAPRGRESIGEIATEVYRERYAGLRGLLRDRDLSLLGRFVAGGDSPLNGELLSALFFAPEMLSRLIELGRVDAEAWLSEEHEEGIWQVGPLPEHAAQTRPPARPRFHRAPEPSSWRSSS